MSDNYTALNIDLDESDMECLRHGSGISFEFDEEDDYTLAVTVGRKDKELDQEWLLGETEPDPGGFSKRDWKALAGVAAVMIGVGQMAVTFVDVFPVYTGGLLAFLGGVYIIDQVRADGPSAGEHT